MPPVCFKCLAPLSDTDPQQHGLHRHCFLQWFDLTALHEFTSLALRSTSKDPENKQTGENSSFFHGQFKKYSAALANQNYILKVRQESAPELPDVEFLSNRLAEQLGLPVAKYYCIQFYGERTFVTRNFIEKRETANLNHIHTHVPIGRNSDCECLIDIIGTTTERFVDVETFILTCLFDSLIGNHDRHGRNLGFIVTSRGTRLAPIYDNPSMLGLHAGAWLEADFNPTGRIPTQATADPSISDYVIEFRRLGYDEQIQLFAKRLNAGRIFATIDASFCTAAMKAALKRLITKRLTEFNNVATA